MQISHTLKGVQQLPENKENFSDITTPANLTLRLCSFIFQRPQGLAIL
jgi:hypothetical protein